jgi:hypothetical protein
LSDANASDSPSMSPARTTQPASKRRTSSVTSPSLWYTSTGIPIVDQLEHFAVRKGGELLARPHALPAGEAHPQSRPALGRSVQMLG